MLGTRPLTSFEQRTLRLPCDDEGLLPSLSSSPPEKDLIQVVKWGSLNLGLSLCGFNLIV